ncbi:MAG: SLATT domain-containing protein [Frankiaceae bacterium]
MTDRVARFRELYSELRIADQRTFYDGRADEYGRAHRQAVNVRNALLLLSAVAGVVGQAVSGSARAWSGVAAAILAALAGAITAYDAMMGHAQLHKLYGDTALNLQEAEIDWDAVTTEDDLVALVQRVEQIFRSENGQWGQLVLKSAARGETSTVTSIEAGIEAGTGEGDR